MVALAPLSGMFSTPHGSLEYRFHEDVVHVSGELRCRQRRFQVSIWYRRDRDDDWTRAGTHRETEFTCDGKPVFDARNERSQLASWSVANLKQILADIRTSWREFMKLNPSLVLECVRQQLRERVETLEGERRALEYWIACKDNNILRLKEAIASDDPEAAAEEVWKNWDQELT
jgi:hypothetical protein